MTPFLARLVGRAAPSTAPVLGARPVVPPLFTAGPAVEPAGEDDWAPPMERPGAAPMVLPTARPAEEPRATRRESPLDVGTPLAPPNRTGHRTEGERPFRVTIHRPGEPPPATGVSAAHSMLEARPAAAVPPEAADLATDRHRRADPGPHAIRTAPVTPLVPAMPASLAPAAPPAPVVRVTIGRIEVRAVTPPTPAPSTRAPAAPPKRTAIVLEDYLRGDAR